MFLSWHREIRKVINYTDYEISKGYKESTNIQLLALEQFKVPVS